MERNRVNMHTVSEFNGIYLNAQMTKLMVFLNSKKKVLNQKMFKFQGNEIEVVSKGI